MPSFNLHNTDNVLKDRYDMFQKSKLDCEYMCQNGSFEFQWDAAFKETDSRGKAH